jgi:hypothetical protein
VSAGKESETRGRRGKGRRIAAKDPQLVATPAPERFGVLLVEGERLLGAVELDPKPVLAACRDLADDD